MLRIRKILFTILILSLGQGVLAADGISYTAKKQEDESPFKFSFGQSYTAPFDRVEGQSDPKFVSAVGLSYKIDKTEAISFSTKYFQLAVSHYDDSHYNGFLNSDLSFSNSEIWSNKKKDMTLGYAIGVTLPTSDSSQMAGMRAGPWANLSGFKKLGAFRLSLTNQVGYYNYRYDTTDPSGEVFNESKYWFVNLSTGLSFGPEHCLNWSVAGTHYAGWDLLGNAYRNYSLSTSLSYMINKNYGIMTMWGTQDQRTENTNMFLYDKMFWTLGIIISV